MDAEKLANYFVKSVSRHTAVLLNPKPKPGIVATVAEVSFGVYVFSLWEVCVCAELPRAGRTASLALSMML
jgi:hypothetical protein